MNRVTCGGRRTIRASRRAAHVMLACLLLLPVTSYAQQRSLLDRVEQFADRGDTREAVRALERWEREFGASASPDERARAWFLAGRLSEDGATAEMHYIRVVIEGSSSRYADDALLRLGQYKFSQGDYGKAIEYLGRLRRDYPTSEHAPTALLWIAQSASASGDAERACSAAEQGLRETPPTDTLLARVFAEAREGCRDTAGRYAVQVAAFKDEEAAQDLARGLLAEGYDAWVLNATPQDPIYRVRIGRGLLRAEAEALLDRLSREGHSAFLVSGSPPIGGGR